MSCMFDYRKVVVLCCVVDSLVPNDRECRTLTRLSRYLLLQKSGGFLSYLSLTDFHEILKMVFF